MRVMFIRVMISTLLTLSDSFLFCIPKQTYLSIYYIFCVRWKDIRAIGQHPGWKLWRKQAGLIWWSGERKPKPSSHQDKNTKPLHLPSAEKPNPAPNQPPDHPHTNRQAAHQHLYHELQGILRLYASTIFNCNKKTKCWKNKIACCTSTYELLRNLQIWGYASGIGKWKGSFLMKVQIENTMFKPNLWIQQQPIITDIYIFSNLHIFTNITLFYVNFSALIIALKSQFKEGYCEGKVHRKKKSNIYANIYTCFMSKYQRVQILESRWWSKWSALSADCFNICAKLYSKFFSSFSNTSKLPCNISTSVYLSFMICSIRSCPPFLDNVLKSWLFVSLLVLEYFDLWDRELRMLSAPLFFFARCAPGFL